MLASAAEPAPVADPLVAEPSRPHFQVLDGLRGVAAVCVFLVHCFSRKVAANGFLGVDFFFMLSGFVIASAYSDRLASGSMGFKEFCLRRFERLWPMLAAATALGLAAALVHNFSNRSEAYSLGGLGLLTVLSLLLLPQVKSVAIDNTAFPLNTVVWSLFFEVVANLAYALVAKFIGIRTAITLAIVGLVAMLVLGTGGGGSIPGFVLGFPRVLFGFFAGVTLWELHRRGMLRRVPGFGLATLAIPLLIVTFIPWQIHGIAFLIPAAIFLALIASGAQVRPSGFSLRTCVLFGALSYPLYLVHRPLLYIVPGVAKKFAPMEGTAYEVAVAITFAVAVCMSYFLERYYEVPIRRWLRSRLGLQKKSAARQG